MELRRMIFEQKHPMVVVCKSGRAMIALNEQVVKTMENMPTGMTDEGEMRYEERETEQYAYDVCWIDGVISDADVLQRAKETVIAAIEAYDTSSSVNGFILNGERVWLDKATRVGLMNSTQIVKAMGQKTTTLWFGGMKIEMNCDKAIGLLSALEMYALECFNVTATHKKAVAELNTVEEVLGYDYTKGYPEKLRYDI
jgi:hypothetical protein